MRRNHDRPSSGAWWRAAAALGVAAALAGCSAGTRTAGGGSAAEPAAAQHGLADAKAPAVAAGAAAAGSASSNFRGSADAAGTAGDHAVVAALGPRLVRTADITVQVHDLGRAADLVRLTAVRFGGRVGSETTGFEQPASSDVNAGAIQSNGAQPDGTEATKAAQGESVLVLRVPEPRLDAAIADLIGQVGGKVLSRTSTSTDVTGDLADLASRVATQRASVVRVRTLLNRATSLQNIVLLESEMSKRESDLEALEARQAALSDQADLATLTVTLRTAEAVAPPRPSGFVAGLQRGWDALQASTIFVLTVLGATLPIAITLAVLAVPLLLVARRRFRHRAAAPAATPAATP